MDKFSWVRVHGNNYLLLNGYVAAMLEDNKNIEIATKLNDDISHKKPLTLASDLMHRDIRKLTSLGMEVLHKTWLGNSDDFLSGMGKEFLLSHLLSSFTHQPAKPQWKPDEVKPSIDVLETTRQLIVARF